ncbi:MAG TPA: 3-phosphoshikimate 1-carboxyvinyltransferase, partial [Deltaproteobacteria bacterium]|nr:3-phosphoshikimate 1-carboxyvinyltransferase [Deltaproteobacteria bacterium]
PSRGDDNLRTLNAFRMMGIEVDEPKVDQLIINGRGLYGLTEPEDVIDAGNSGTTVRLLTGLL